MENWLATICIVVALALGVVIGNVVNDCPEVVPYECPDCVCGTCKECEVCEVTECETPTIEIEEPCIQEGDNGSTVCPSGLNSVIVCGKDEYVHWFRTGLCECRAKDC